MGSYPPPERDAPSVLDGDVRGFRQWQPDIFRNSLLENGIHRARVDNARDELATEGPKHVDVAERQQFRSSGDNTVRKGGNRHWGESLSQTQAKCNVSSSIRRRGLPQESCTVMT